MNFHTKITEEETRRKRRLASFGYRADILVENEIIIEIKSIERLAPIHFLQIMTYLKLGHFKLGLLINFNEVLLKSGLRRIVNGY